MSTYFELTNLIEGVNSTVTSGGNLALTASSKTMQRLTGTSSHTVTLPDATTLKNIGRRFSIKNRSSQSVIVNNFGGSLIATLTTNTQRDFVVSNVSSSNGVWELAGDSGSTGGGGSASVQSSDTLKMLQGLAASNYQDDNIVSKILKYNKDEIGADNWIFKTSLSTAKFGPAGAAFNGYGYEVGGYVTIGGTPSNPTERYDDDNNYWLQRAVHLFATASAVALPSNGALYLFGGANDSSGTTTRKYLDSTDTWSQLATYSGTLSSCAGSVIDNVMYFYGFVAGVGATCITYDATANAYYARANQATSASGGTAFDLNGFAYYNGGSSSNTASQRFNPALNSWRLNSTLNSGRQFATGFNIQGFGYACAGETAVITNVVEEYNDINNYWRFRQSLSANRSDQYASGFGLHGVGYLAGGSTGGSGFTATVVQYSNSSLFSTTVTKTSQAIPTTLLVSAALSAIANKIAVQVRTDGENWKNLNANEDNALKFNETFATKYLETGLGYASGGNGPSNTSEKYNDNINVWVLRANLNTARGYGGFGQADGFGFNAGGEAPGTTNINERYDEIVNVYAVRAVLPSSVETVGSFSILGFFYIIGGSGALSSVYRYSNSLNSWATKTSLNTGREAPGSFNLHDHGYAAGGFNGSALSSTERYNTITDAWTNRGSKPTTTYRNPGLTLAGYGYSIGGNQPAATAAVEKYDDQADSWSTVGSLLATRPDYAGSFRLSGFGYTMGGSGASTEKYNPGSNVWSSVASMNQVRLGIQNSFQPGTYRKYELKVILPSYIAGIGSGAWINKTSLIVTRGGSNGVSLSNVLYVISGQDTTTEKYNISNDTWTKSANINTTRYNFASFSLLGYIYATGGNPGDSTMQYFNEQANVWSTRTSITTANDNFPGAALNGYGYALGGFASANTVQQYDPRANSWSSKASQSNKGISGAASLNGYLYSVGGIDNSNVTSALVQQYNDSTNAWSTKGSMTTAKFGPICTPINGKIFAAGGSNGSYVGSYTVLASSEEYNDSMDVWSVKPSLNTVRSCWGGSGDITVNNSIIIAAGWSTAGGSTNAVEQFSPSINDIVLGIALEAK